ncbi:MAG: hypothetical protein AAF657_04690, partial [Acidobacteriota bacterium]
MSTAVAPLATPSQRTTLVPTTSVANLADFGAIPELSTAAVIQGNAQAFRDAFDSGARRIAIPEGTWHFEEILYQGNAWLPVGVEIFGQGREGQTHLIYHPNDPAIPAFSFAPNTLGLLSRSTLRNFRLTGPTANALNQPPQGIGISFDQSLYNHVRDVVIWDFEIGIQFSAGPTPYSGHNNVERFEVNRCRTGV